MIFWLLFFTILFLFLISLKLFNKNILSPSIMTTGVFLLGAFCIALNYINWMVTYSFKGYIIVIIGLIIVILAECFAKFVICKGMKKKNSIFKPLKIPRITNITLTLCSLLCFLYFSSYILKLGSSLNADGLLAIGIVKDSTEITVGGLPLLAYDFCFYLGFIYIFIFCKNIFACKQSILKNLKYGLVIIIGICAVIFRGARGPLFQYIIAFIFLAICFLNKDVMYSSKRKKKTFVKLIITGFIFLLAFYNLKNIVKGRTINTPFLDYITYYIGSPLYLFDKVINSTDYFYEGYHYFGAATFTNLYGTLYQLGLISNNVSGLSFMKVSISTGFISGNEFTIFMRPYFDFGFGGMCIFIFLFYLFFSSIYYKEIYFRKYNKRQETIMLIYSVFFYQIAMSFYLCFTCQDVRPQTLLFIAFLLIIYKFVNMPISNIRKELNYERNNFSRGKWY